jgi:hypothetical protein
MCSTPLKQQISMVVTEQGVQGCFKGVNSLSRRELGQLAHLGRK